MVLLDFSIYPLDKGEAVGEYVAQALEIIDSSGLPYKLGPMGTSIEGEWNQVMEVVKRCFDGLRQDCHRIECIIKVDYRKGAEGRITGKIEDVENIIGKKLKT